MENRNKQKKRRKYQIQSKLLSNSAWVRQQQIQNFSLNFMLKSRAGNLNYARGSPYSNFPKVVSLKVKTVQLITMLNTYYIFLSENSMLTKINWCKTHHHAALEYISHNRSWSCNCRSSFFFCFFFFCIVRWSSSYCYWWFDGWPSKWRVFGGAFPVLVVGLVLLRPRFYMVGSRLLPRARRALNSQWKYGTSRRSRDGDGDGGHWGHHGFSAPDSGAKERRPVWDYSCGW